MKTQRIIALAIIALTMPLVAQNRAIEFEHSKWQEIVQKAKTENKLIFVDAYASWCGPCKWMAANSFTNDSVADLYNSTFVNAKIDMEKEEGPELQKTFQVRAFPTLIFIDPSTLKIVHRAVGGMEPAELIALAKVATDPENRLSGYAQRYAAGKLDNKGIAQYIGVLSAAMVPADTIVDSYLKSLKPADIPTKENWEMFKGQAKAGNKAFDMILKYQKQFTALVGADVVSDQISNTYLSGASLYLRKKDEKGLETYKSQIRNSGYAHANQILLTIDVQQAAMAKDWVKFAAVGNKLVADKTFKNVNQLNYLANVIYYNSTANAQLQYALNWSKRLLQLQKSPMTLQTLANIQFKLGKKSEALASMTEAIELARKEGTSIEGLENRMKEMKGEGVKEDAQKSIPATPLK